MAWNEDLDPDSQAFQIASSRNPRIRVVAGPGTGKSFAMKRRVARLLEDGVDPHRILPVTFTRVAAEDIHRELVGMNVDGCDRIEGMTLHGLAFRQLSRNHVLRATGRTPRPLNDFELKPMRADLAIIHRGVRRVKKSIKAYEAAWARLQHEQPGYAQEQGDQQFAEDLVQWLTFHKAMLIGEVVPLLYDYLRNNPGAAERTEFSHILVDEYQDLNKAEQSIVDLLADEAEVCIVGDDDQSIYAFKYAHPEGIREWINNEPDADDVALEECHRCPTRVVGMASHLIQTNQNRPVPRRLLPKDEKGVGNVSIVQYQTLNDEVAGVAQRIMDLIAAGTPPGDILVLAQRGLIGTPIHERLVEHGIPTKSYYAEAELDQEDAQRRFSLLKLFVDSEDRVALRWLLGLGSQSWRSSSYTRLKEYCAENNVSPWQALRQLHANEISVPYTNRLVSKFAEILTELETLEEIEDFRAVIDHLFPENEVGIRDLRALSIQVLEDIGDDRREFLRELSNCISKPEVPSEVEEVRIMSLHKSKGLSAPVTFVCGCVQGLLPKLGSATASDAERMAVLEEQRRLFYVGITRVKAKPEDGKPGMLFLTYSRRMPIADARHAGIEPAEVRRGIAHLNASQFIGELGPTAPPPVAG